MDIRQMIERIGKNIGATEDALRARMEVVLAENQTAWLDAGKTEDDCNINALRIAGRQIKSEGERLKRSGATLFEGMFVSVPRYKDWAQLAYKKAANTLNGGNSAMIEQMVDEGHWTVYEDNNDGTYTKRYNPSLARGDAFESGTATADISELPKGAYDAGAGVHFHIVWDKNSPKFPSGDKNFKYGQPRPQSEKDRQTLFLGRAAGSSDVRLYNFRFNGALADNEPPTFVTGRIAMRPARNGDTAYGKAGVSVFSQDDSLQSEVFTQAPDQLVGELGRVKVLEEGLQQIRSYVESLSDKERWDAVCTVMTEVVHIDPRDNGGYIITVGDLDIMSIAGTTDIYVPAGHEALVDFSVGSTLMLIGQPYISRDDEARLITTGWWCAESLGGGAAVASSEMADAEGWD